MARYPALKNTPDKFNYNGKKLCRNCNNLVVSGRRHYCSSRCMNTFMRENTWFFVRKDVLRRDKYKCSICLKRYAKTKLDVDHIIPVQMGGGLFDKLNLRVLCKECHLAKSKLDREGLKELNCVKSKKN